MRSRNPYGSSASDFSYSFGPGPMTPVIKALIIANVAVFIITTLARSAFDLTGALGLIPERVVHFEVWRIVTYLFLHAGVMHILFNMLSLWMFGVELERRWGSQYFLKYYFVCGVGAAATVLLLSFLPFSTFSTMYFANTVGASGA